jgi:hypothetical protein
MRAHLVIVRRVRGKDSSQLRRVKDTDSDEPITARHVRSLGDSVAKLDEGRLARNNRIVAKGILNQYCALVAVLESMLLHQVPKILLQHYLG